MENTDCIFCKIVKGEVPSNKIYEDDNFLAFLDINPQVEGEVLVIPKKHYRWVYDVEDFEEYWGAVKKVTDLLKEKLTPAFITYYTYGMDIPHAHIHVLPRKSKNEQMESLSKIKPSPEELASLADKIRK